MRLIAPSQAMHHEQLLGQLALRPHPDVECPTNAKLQLFTYGSHMSYQAGTNLTRFPDHSKTWATKSMIQSATCRSCQNPTTNERTREEQMNRLS
eukprot:6367932-Amphidinium_carterae.2